VIHRYLESGTWIKILRNASFENKKKINVDPSIFMKGIKDKKTVILQKYQKILKDIIDLMKVSDLKNCNKFSVIS
jgi:hypothetical protein